MKNQQKQALYGYLYIAPSLILISIFSLIPILMTLYFSFTDYNIIQAPTFTGLKNYIRMLGDPFVVSSMKNTFIFTLFVVPTQTILSMVIASVLAQKFQNKLGGFIKSSLFIPVISSTILVGTLWSFLLATDTGIINTFLALIGLDKVNWLGTKFTSLLSVCLVSIWKNVGYFLVIFYAGIMEIPKMLYESGQVDGANKYQQFWYITMPMLKPITFLVVTLGTIWSFQIFDLVYVMTGGGPGRSTITLVMTIYNTAFKEFSMGYASTISLLLLVFIVIISSIQKLLFKDNY
ncbi:sugar ABC transporter permease [Vallitaleaceae bacterium 9-2]